MIPMEHQKGKWLGLDDDFMTLRTDANNVVDIVLQLLSVFFNVNLRILTQS